MNGWTKQEVETELKRRLLTSLDGEKTRKEAKRRLSVPVDDRCIHCHVGEAGRSGLCDDCLVAD